MISRLFRRLTRFLGLSSAEAELTTEMQHHFDHLVAEFRAEGLSERDARLAAQKEFGTADAYIEACRDVWRPNWFSGALRDLRHAARSLRRTPGFAATATVTLALGIGACTVMFSVIESVLLNALPVRDQDGLVFFWENNPERGITTFSQSVPNFVDYREQATSFAALIGVDGRSVNLADVGGTPVQATATGVTAGFSDAFGWRMVLGRDFRPEEDVPGGPKVAILGEDLWRNRYHADPTILEQTITIDRESYQVVGVVERGVEIFGESDLWRPLAPNPEQVDRDDHWLSVLGRLAPGVTIEQAQAEVDQIAASLRAAHPDSMKGWGAYLQPAFDVVIPPELARGLRLLFAAVGLLLLIACANVANLLLSRALTRGREIAVRTALGATRGQLVRQMLAETAVLATAGAALGTLLSFWGLDLLRPFAADALPRGGEIGLDTGSLLFAGGAAVVTTFLAGLLPALRGTRTDIAEPLGSTARTVGASRSQHRLRDLLVVTQITLSVALLVGAGLLLRSFGQLQDVNPGFDPRGVLGFQITPDRQTYGETAPRLELYRRMKEQIGALPGVSGVGMSSGLPFGQGRTGLNVFARDDSAVPADESIQSAWRIVDQDFFTTLHIPVVAGRAFEAQDRNWDAPVIILNQALAERFWPHESAIGKRVNPGGGDNFYTVVGVVGNVHLSDFAEGGDYPQMYFPITLWTGWDSMMFAVRSELPPESLTASVRRIMRDLDPQQPVYRFDTLEGLTQEALRTPRMNAWLLGIFAGVALVLASVGIYAVMHTNVAQRTREIGVRMALGAQRGDVQAMMLRRGGQLILTGVAAGAALAWPCARLLESFLFQTAPTDLTVYAGASAIIALAAFIAIWLPARRATLVDPIVALRAE